jgi:superfamily II DNA or RNA helicase
LKRVQEIDRLIGETRAELEDLGNRHSAALEKLRQLQIQKEQLAQATVTVSFNGPKITKSSPQDEKISLFRTLFKGREDVFPKRYESTKSGKSGYTPNCKNEWVTGICEKPRIKCMDCAKRVFIVLSDTVIESHLKGYDIKSHSKHDYTIGVYPILPDETCWFLAIDFDKKAWTIDALAFLDTCDQFDVPAALERSRSGDGAHVWIFFSDPIPASTARKLGTFLLTKTMEIRPEIGLDSYDRLFPSQDTIPKGGFGNLIALPLQNKPRKSNNSVFVDGNLVPFEDQWAFLSSIRRMSSKDIENIVQQFSTQDEIIGIHSVKTEENKIEPWLEPPSRKRKEVKITGPLPDQLEIVLENQVYLAKKSLPPALLNRVIRIAAFQNPEFYKAQAMPFPTYNKPRIINCCEDFPDYIGIPRGCLEKLISLLESHNIEVRIKDKRFTGFPIEVGFSGKLYEDQQKAANDVLSHDTGVLSVPTAFGKTVIAIYILAARRVNTLILVHRRQLLDQWLERLSTFLKLDSKCFGQIYGGKRKLTGFIDIALIQSLNRKGTVDDVVGEYGQIIVDECHHMSARSFEIVARQSKAKYVTGLSATTVRKDGHHPIIFMNCGVVRHRVTDKKSAENRPFSHTVIVRHTEFKPPTEISEKDSPMIHEIYSALISNNERNGLIVDDVIKAVDNGRSPLILTERRDHLEYLYCMLSDKVQNVFALKGGMGKKQIKELFESIKTIKNDEERVLVATGKYLGEGFDDARLDTLFLTLPISWKGTLAQYAGRLHRLYYGKTEVIVYDYIDLTVPMLTRMYERRLKGYKSLGYSVKMDDEKEIMFGF